MALAGGIHRRGGERRGFTLIELIVVILIILILVVILLVAIFAVFGSTKKGVTKTALESLGGAWNVMVAKENWNILATPRDEMHRFSDEFRKDAGVALAGGVREMSPEHKSMLLALMMCSTLENWQRAMAKGPGGVPPYEPPITEESARAFRERASSGWDVVRDGWGSYIAYAVDFNSESGGAPKFTLISPGEDRDYSTTNDNWYWTKDKGVHRID